MIVTLERFLDAWFWAWRYLDGGFRPWRRQAKMALSSRMPERRYFVQRLGFFRRRWLDVTMPVADKLEALRMIKPDTLVCWATVLDEIVTELERIDSHLNIPLVFTSSSTLYPHVRRRAERRLNGRVSDAYGSIETGPVAWECEQRLGYHVRSDRVIVELLDNDRPAKQGRIVCTVLWRRAFPLIRYALGDSAEWSDAPCPCGQPYPLLTNLRGRTSELVRLPDGSRINSVALEAPAFGKPGVRQHRLVQETPTRFRLCVAAGPEFTPEVEAAVSEEFYRRFGNQLELRVVKSPHLPCPPGIKFVPIVTLEYIERLKSQGVDVSVFAGQP